MKSAGHPKYYEKAQVTCACGHTFTTGSTLKKIKVDICSNCHPFFTGKMKFVDTMGRVEKFQKSVQSAKKKKYIKKSDKKRSQKEKFQPTTLKEMIESQKKPAKKS